MSDRALHGLRANKKRVSGFLPPPSFSVCFPGPWCFSWRVLGRFPPPKYTLPRSGKFHIHQSSGEGAYGFGVPPRIYPTRGCSVQCFHVSLQTPFVSVHKLDLVLTCVTQTLLGTLHLLPIQLALIAGLLDGGRSWSLFIFHFLSPLLRLSPLPRVVSVSHSLICHLPLDCVEREVRGEVGKRELPLLGLKAVKARAMGLAPPAGMPMDRSFSNRLTPPTAAPPVAGHTSRRGHSTRALYTTHLLC